MFFNVETVEALVSYYRRVHREDENFSAYYVFESCGHVNSFRTVEVLTKHIKVDHTDLGWNIIYPPMSQTQE